MYDGLTREVAQFLFRKARLLDERRSTSGSAFTEDARYWVDVPQTLLLRVPPQQRGGA